MKATFLFLLFCATLCAMKWHHEHAQVEGRDYNIAYRFIDLGAGDGPTTLGTEYVWFWEPDTNETRRVWMGDDWTTVQH